MDSNDAMDIGFQPEQQNSTLLTDLLQLLENNGTGTFESPNIADTQSVTSPASMSSSSASSSPTFTGMSQRSPPQTNTIEGDPYIRIVEQPHSKGLRFRYICEGRSAGSIPGINSTPENKTYPTIEIVGYTGNVKIIVSCVTVDEPHRPHPHNLVGKEGCEYGVCTMRLKGAPMRAVFSNLGIQCVKKKDIRAALEERERINIDPFKTKFVHKDQPTNIDLNVVRLCFQAFIPTGPRQYYKLKPVVTEPIYDKKSINDLVICRLCSCSAKVNGGDTIFLLCEKLPKDDIKIRFYEEKDNKVIWEDYGEFQQTDIHKQTAIAFKTPRYHNTDIVKRAQVYIQLVRFSNDPTVAVQTTTFSQVSDPLPFEFYPDPGMRSFPRIQRKLKRRQDMEIFQQIISLDSETTATKYSEISMNDEAENDLDNDTDETATTNSSSSQARSSGTLNEHQVMRKFPNTSMEEDDDNDNGDDDVEDEDENVIKGTECRKTADMGIEFNVPDMGLPSIDDCTQTSTPMEEILRNTELGAVRQLAALDKITQWMKSNERTDSLTVETDQFKRKRLRSGGNPMRIIQELQQIDQMHNNSNNNNNNTSNITNTMWNIPPGSSSPSASTVPEIKNEPFLSPNYGGTYRTPYQMSPSPQPSSPMNRNSATPSPGLVKTSSAESQSQMCNAFNQIQVNYNYSPNVNVNNGNSGSNNINPFLDGRNEYTNTNQLHPTTTTTSPSNPFFNPTSGGSITPLYPGVANNANLTHTSQFQAFNIANNNNTVGAASTLNIVDNQFQYQYQYQQHHQQQQTQTQLPEDTNEAAVTLNALLQIDSDNFVNINSEELRLSNLSIST